MRNIQINEVAYSVLEVRENITLADSFVAPKNKIGSGNGEAKLYIGNESSELRSFYGGRGFVNSSFLLKEDLLLYLKKCKNEYENPTQDYRAKDKMSQLWNERINFVSGLDSVIRFDIKEQQQITPPRVYVKSENPAFTLIRELSLPNLSLLSIYKLDDFKGNILYYYYLDYYNISKEIETGVENEIEDNENFQPYNTEKISIDTKPMLLEACLRRIEQNKIILSPDFQRNEVWNITKKSRLIESLMLKIPIPMFYVSADESGTYSVVDGLQRLSTIRSFVLGDNYLETEDIKLKGNGFKLENLEFWGEKYNYSSFNELPIEMQNRILETQFTFTIINPGTPEEVKRNIFKRINTGGEPLTPQEIRNALYTGNATSFLKKLSESKEFIQATNDSIKTERMMDKELVLRSLSFLMRNYTTYPKSNDMDRFLSDTMRIINLVPNIRDKEGIRFFKEESLKKEGIKQEDIYETDLTVIEILFLKGMKRSYKIFGDHTFRKSYKGKRRTPINKALLEVWTVLLSKISDSEFEKLQTNKKTFLTEYNEYLEDDSFNYVISRDSLKYSSVQERYKTLQNLLNKFII